MNGEKPKIISSKTRNETSMSTQHRAWVLSQSNKARE
jgi:hypothetical protein